ncbi:MBL fold metallo-hydrolase [Euhalothece natronophila Z-M001]|uniref:MBL fold metallo-hydrolase n=1 Tax=Euhalothece natronophila Z-M001 TaxID=522448 RepID=A0A5B8NHY6_9CHRO|nr:MBL fold metallo-hydrolase [Euhalothece natronophila]QDZ38564.1 MBL fold metallo-hydrolase [Euhalothece natronophila Z-M001]
MQLTYLGSNSWLWQWENQNILVDPWLVDNLVFGNLPWLFKGSRGENSPVLPERIDLILLSQGLEDHAHKPTLKTLDKEIPVVGSPNAAKVATELGFMNVTGLAHHEHYTLAEKIKIQALPGAPIGLEKENAYLLKTSQKSLYYEPHGYPPEELKEYAPVDVVINPVVNLELPVAGSIINGKDSVFKLAQWIQPKTILATAAGGDIHYEGILLSLLKTVGSAEEARSRLKQANLNTEIIEPQQGQPIAL